MFDVYQVLQNTIFGCTQNSKIPIYYKNRRISIMVKTPKRVSLSELIKIVATLITTLGVILGTAWVIVKPFVEKVIIESLPVNLNEMNERLDVLNERVSRMETNMDALRYSIVKQDTNMQIIIFLLRQTDTGRHLNLDELRRKSSEQNLNNN